GGGEQAGALLELGFEVQPEKRSSVGFGRLADMVGMIEAVVSEHEYLVGNRFSPADLYLGMELYWAMAAGAIEKRSALERYVARLRSRPAAIPAPALDAGPLPN